MFGQHPLQKNLHVQRHTDPSAVATAGTRAGSPVFEAYQAHSAIPAGCPPTRQIGDPLAGRSRKGPNMESKVDEEMW